MRESTQQAGCSRELEDLLSSAAAVAGGEDPVVQWLLSAAPDVQQARWEWAEDGLTFLRCGAVFTAIRLPGGLVRAAAGSSETAEVDAYLAEVLDGSPVIATRDLRSYYPLVPPSAGLLWKHPDAECLAWGTWLGVPPVKRTTYVAEGYWAVPASTPAKLCDVAAVDALTRRGRARVGVES